MAKDDGLLGTWGPPSEVQWKWLQLWPMVIPQQSSWWYTLIMYHHIYCVEYFSAWSQSARLAVGSTLSFDSSFSFVAFNLTSKEKADILNVDLLISVISSGRFPLMVLWIEKRCFHLWSKEQSCQRSTLFSISSNMLLHLSCQPAVDTQEISSQVVLFQSCPYMHLVSSAEDVFDSISNQNI